MHDEWVDLASVPGLVEGGRLTKGYEISRSGVVRSFRLDRPDVRREIKPGFVGGPRLNMRKPRAMIRLSVEHNAVRVAGRSAGRGVVPVLRARLVAWAFHGPPPSGAMADHIDCNGLNDTADNVRWVSPDESWTREMKRRGMPGYVAARLAARIELLSEEDRSYITAFIQERCPVP